VGVYAAEQSYISYFNSPYYAHSNLSGIDIYDQADFGDQAPSPLSGRVTKIFTYEPPLSKWFDSSRKAEAIFLEAKENPNIWVKILHLKPEVKVGDVVEVTDILGRYLREGFFALWTRPHIHLELRDPHDHIRARGAYQLSPYFGTCDNLQGSPLSENIFRGVVGSLGEGYVFVKLQGWIPSRIGQFYGITGKIGDSWGLIDGGLPHYRKFGFFGEIREDRIIKAFSTELGIFSSSITTQIHTAECKDISVRLNEMPCIGISCYLSLRPFQVLKIVLNNRNPPFENNSNVKLEITTKPGI
jgi:hypothetical protein